MKHKTNILIPLALVVNSVSAGFVPSGDFESVPTGIYEPYDQIGDWTVLPTPAGGSTATGSPFMAVSDISGSNVLHIAESTIPIGVSQVIHGLTPGWDYRLSFDVTGYAGSVGDERFAQLLVHLKIGSIDDIYSYFASSHAVNPWQNITADFTATATSSLLSLEGSADGFSGLYIDSVSLDVTAVPEPLSSSVIAGFSVMAFAFVRTRTRERIL